MSRIDGATLDYALWYPPRYDESRTWPLIVFLHGSGEGDDWKSPTKPEASIPVRTSKPDLKFLVAFPLMRGSWSVNGPAELDVIDTINDVQQRARVDPDRIHLTGLSMGGFAAWAIAAHRPDLFASLSIFAAGGQPELVGNLRHLAIRVRHGNADTLVPAAEAVRMAEALRSARIPVDFKIMESVPHICWRGDYGSEGFYSWLANHRRQCCPKRISYRTRSLRHNRAYWMTIDSMIDPSVPAVIDVFAPDGKQVLVHAENVGRLTLDPPDEVGYRGTMPEFFVNNEPIRPERTPRGWTLRVDDSTDTGIAKRHGLSGPIQDVFYDAFIVVVPTLGDAETTTAWQQVARRSFEWLAGLTYQNVRIINDVEVTDETVSKYNLICFGNPDNHAILSRVGDQLPLSFSGGGLMVEGRRASADVAAFVMIHPNPLNSDRYMVVCSGRPEVAGTLGAVTLQPPFLASTPLEDLVMLGGDGVPILESSEAKPLPTWMAPDLDPRGFVFDRNWRLPESALRRLLGIVASSGPNRPGGIP